MLKYYVRRSEGEQFQKVTTPPKDNVWIHGDVVTEHDLRNLSTQFSMDFNILRDVLDKDELPRVEIQQDALYVFVRTVTRSKHGQITTTPVLLAVKDTVFANVSAIVTTDNKLATPSVAAQSIDTYGLLLGTFAAVVSEYEDLMKHTARYIHDTAQRLRTHEVTNEDFVRFVTVEDNLNEYHMNLSAMLVVAERLRETLNRSNDTEAVEDILLYIRQLLVAITSYNQSITSIRNAYGTIANNVLNQRMKTLTVLTVLIALPNVFYGMYGMNVALPFQEQPWAYGVVLGMSVTIMVLVFAIARKRGIF
ncbi:MAG TPA: CorA family divalent cation transporter [Candidatus Saccharimonadales bacterium]|nr:CorA family divalent cation transporter [Candidatus Saccharimonadales bacterium]